MPQSRLSSQTKKSQRRPNQKPNGGIQLPRHWRVLHHWKAEGNPSRGRGNYQSPLCDMYVLRMQRQSLQKPTRKHAMSEMRTKRPHEDRKSAGNGRSSRMHKAGLLPGLRNFREGSQPPRKDEIMPNLQGMLREGDEGKTRRETSEAICKGRGPQLRSPRRTQSKSVRPPASPHCRNPRAFSEQPGQGCLHRRRQRKSPMQELHKM